MTALRAARASDIPAMFRLAVEVRRTAYAPWIPESHRKDFFKSHSLTEASEYEFVTKVREHLADLQWYVVVADNDGVINGYVIARRDGEDNRRVTELFIAPTQQHRGLGRQLFEAALAWLGDGPISLKVLAANEPAIGFYRHYDFEVTGLTAKQYYGLDELVMRRARN